MHSDSATRSISRYRSKCFFLLKQTYTTKSYSNILFLKCGRDFDFNTLKSIDLYNVISKNIAIQISYSCALTIKVI